MSSTPANVAVNAMKRLRKKNFWDLSFLFSDFGVGLRFIRRIWWNKPETYWTITRVVPTSNVGLIFSFFLIDTLILRCIDVFFFIFYQNPRTKGGIAYGVFTYLGVREERERKVRCTTKRDWRYVPREQTIAHWPMWNRKDMDMNHTGYPLEFKEKYYDLVEQIN